MRTSEAALALIQRPRDGEAAWLARWNEKWGAFHLVGGHRDAGEPFRDCMARELREELGLREGTDCDVGTDPLARLDYAAESRSAQVETRYLIELFRVDLRDRDGRAFESRAEVRWLSVGEILRGNCDDGRPVSPTMNLLLTKAGLLG